MRRSLKEAQIEMRERTPYLAGTDIELAARVEKMSKSRGNVVNPDEVIEEYGADSMRLYEMFMGPLEASKPWSMRGVEGVYRFLSRVWRLFIDDRAAFEIVPQHWGRLRLAAESAASERNRRAG